MKMEDLKVGMHIITREGNRLIVLPGRNGLVASGPKDWGPIEDFQFSGVPPDHRDIMRVWVPRNNQARYNFQASDAYTQIYKWGPVEEMTLSQVIKELGKEIKIIEG